MLKNTIIPEHPVYIYLFSYLICSKVDHWRKSSALTKTGENRGNFLIVVKLFFIMGKEGRMEG